MSAQDNTEKVLRSLHVLLSKSEPYAKEPSKVIVDKQQMLDLLSELNKSIYDIMDEYELTKSSRDRAEREFQKKGDQIVWDASRKAEDIYAASVMYTDEALSGVQDVIHGATSSIQEIYEEMDRKLKEQESLVRKNQSELKAQLQDLLDTEKYLKLIEDRNREIEKEKAHKEGHTVERKPSIYANRQTEIKVNTAQLAKLGLSSVEETEEASEDLKDSGFKELSAEEFGDEQPEETTSENEMHKESAPVTDPRKADSKDLSESIHKAWKNLTSGKK
jgi:hypothetical protein